MTTGQPGRVDWRWVTWRLLHKCGLRPWEVRKLTLAEIGCYLEADGDRPRPPAGGRTLTDAEIDAERKRRASMTILDKLREARGG